MESKVRTLRKALNLTQEQLASRLGIGKSALSMIETGRAALSERNKRILVEEFHVNPDWLDTGRGECFAVQPEFNPYLHRTDRTLPMQSVPLYDIRATAGLVPLFADACPVEPESYIHIPNLPRCDGAVYVAGDSMAPILSTGDIVLYRRLEHADDLFWGDMYLLSVDVDGDEYITVKYVERGERAGYVRLVSHNPRHAPKEVAIDRIRAVAMIKASIRLNAMH